jgi:ribosomal protein S18 acetylase RimI-like enzyme
MVRHENHIARALYDASGFQDPERALLTKRLP